MDVKSDSDTRHRRKARNDDDDKWECSVCTYINPKESYKCEICFMRKGTSTRKPRLNPQVLEQQQFIAQAILKEKDEEHRKKKSDRPADRSTSNDTTVKLKNFDRTSPLLFEIFANGYSVVITEFPPKSKGRINHFPDSPAASNCSSLLGFSANANQDQLSPTDSNSNSDAVSRVFPLMDSEFADRIDSKPRVSGCSAKAFQCVSVKPASPFAHTHSGSVEVVHPSRLSSTLPIPASSSSSSIFKQDPVEPVPFCDSGCNVTTANSDSELARRKLNRKSARASVSRRVPSRSAKSNNKSKILTAKRLPSPNDMKLLISSRQKRLLSDDSSNTPAKRRKLALSRSQSTRSNSKRRRSCPLSSSNRPFRSGTGESLRHQKRYSRADSLRIRSNLKEGLTPINMKKNQPNKRYSSTPLDLKCKLPMPHPPDSTATLSPSTNNGPQRNSMETAKLGTSCDPLQSGINVSSVLDRSMPESVEPALVNPSRLSSESRNTSAMTDSAGATALEISE